MSVPERNIDVAAERRGAVEAALAEIRAIETAQGISRSSLDEIKAVLVALAKRPELFPDRHFPGPSAGEIETLYGISEDPDHRFALYVYRPAPGKVTSPHNHSTWAVVVGIEGEEATKGYRRLDGGSAAGPARIEVEKEFVVGPAGGMGYMPHDIHSIHIGGDRPIKHLHMYGTSLLHLPDRLDFDVEAGTCRPPAGKPVVLQPVAD